MLHIMVDQCLIDKYQHYIVNMLMHHSLTVLNQLHMVDKLIVQ
jgi:hypothetical protein